MVGKNKEHLIPHVLLRLAPKLTEPEQAASRTAVGVDGVKSQMAKLSKSAIIDHGQLAQISSPETVY